MPARGRARPGVEARERLAQAAVHERPAKAAVVRGQLAEAPVRGRQERVAA